MWESLQRFPSLALVPGVICRPFKLRLFVVRAAGDKPLLCREPPTPCVPSCWLKPLLPPACACVIPNWPATYSGPKIASSSAAARYVLPGRRAFAGICSHVCWSGELLLAPGGVLAGHHPQPGSKSPALLEGCPVTDGRDGSCGDHRSNAGDRHQAPALFKFAGDAFDQLV